jgi:hypothetical protein
VHSLALVLLAKYPFTISANAAIALVISATDKRKSNALSDIDTIEKILLYLNPHLLHK